jgi:hypothetical protein
MSNRDLICEHGNHVMDDGCDQCSQILWTDPLHKNAGLMLEALKAAEKVLNKRSKAYRLVKEAIDEASAEPEYKTVCEDCGDETEDSVGCIDGATICKACFNSGAH